MPCSRSESDSVLMDCDCGTCWQVTSCVWSSDGELVVSGSMDCTIRVWRALTGVALAVCDTGLSIQRVLLADNKQTIVALGGDVISPKLVMLQVTRTRHADLRPKVIHGTTPSTDRIGD